MNPKYLYMVLGMGAGRSMECVVVERYEILRETPHRWYVNQRGGERWFSKKNSWQFTDLDELKKTLKAVKQRRLEEARSVVEKLEGITTVRFHNIPPIAPEKDPIKII